MLQDVFSTLKTLAVLAVVMTIALVGSAFLGIYFWLGAIMLLLIVMLMGNAWVARIDERS